MENAAHKNNQMFSFLAWWWSGLEIFVFPAVGGFLMWMLTASVFLWQPKEEHWEEEPGAGEQVHRGAGRADIR